MKYSLLLSLLSLIAWKYDCLFPAGLFGLLAGFLFSLLFRRTIQILAIGYISASILTVILFPIEFSFAAIARIGIAWAAAITALMTFLILFSLIIKTKEKLQYLLNIRPIENRTLKESCLLFIITSF